MTHGDAASPTVACDANALDRDGSERDKLVDRFRELAAAGLITLVVTDGVRHEMADPGTPADVRQAMPPAVTGPQRKLTQQQQIARFCVQSILGGDARPGKHAADATHLSEAAEAGCSFFITHDKRILKKRSELADVLPATLRIVTLAKFLEIADAP